MSPRVKDYRENMVGRVGRRVQRSASFKDTQRHISKKTFCRQLSLWQGAFLPSSAIYEYFFKKQKHKQHTSPLPNQFQTRAEHLSQEQNLDQDTVLRDTKWATLPAWMLSTNHMPGERLMLKLKLQFSSHLMRRTDSVEKTLMLGKIESRWRRG